MYNPKDSHDAASMFFSPAYNLYFENNGYCVVENALLSTCAQRAYSLFQRWEDSYKSAAFHSTFQIKNLEHRREVYSGLKSIYNHVICLILSSYKIVWAGFAVKHPSGKLSELGLHQDVSMCDLSTGRAPITAWIPLQNISEIGGRISVVPKWKFFDPSPRAYGQIANFEYSDMDNIVATTVTLNISLGQLLLFHQALLHCSSGNASENVRVAVMLIMLPIEKPVVLFKIGQKSGEIVTDNYYVDNMLEVR